MALAIDDDLSAIIPGWLPKLSLTSHAARVVALGREATLKLPKPLTPVQHFDRLVEVDHALPEGTPLFKDGKLAGLVLMGTRFLGQSSGKSYVVPVDRFAALCSRLETGKSAVEKTTTFEPLDCVLVDEKTGEPVPGDDFAINLRYVIPRKARGRGNSSMKSFSGRTIRALSSSPCPTRCSDIQTAT